MCKDAEADVLERIQRQRRNAAGAAAQQLKQVVVVSGAAEGSPAAAVGISTASPTSMTSPVDSSVTSPKPPMPHLDRPQARNRGMPRGRARHVKRGFAVLYLLAILCFLLQASIWSMSVSSLDLPRELQQFYEAQRIIVMDAIRCRGEGALIPTHPPTHWLVLVSDAGFTMFFYHLPKIRFRHPAPPLLLTPQDRFQEEQPVDGQRHRPLGEQRPRRHVGLASALPGGHGVGAGGGRIRRRARGGAVLGQRNGQVGADVPFLGS